MIFGSLFLLLVSAVLLAFGIGKSTPSLLLLVLALISAVMASLLLLAAYQAHKVRLALAGGGTGAGIQSGRGAGRAGDAGVRRRCRWRGVLRARRCFGAAADVRGSSQQREHCRATRRLRLHDFGPAREAHRERRAHEDQKMAIVAYESAHQQRKTVIAALNAKAE